VGPSKVRLVSQSHYIRHIFATILSDTNTIVAATVLAQLLQAEVHGEKLVDYLFESSAVYIRSDRAWFYNMRYDRVSLPVEGLSSQKPGQVLKAHGRPVLTKGAGRHLRYDPHGV
jgi:hypothetical protein